MLAGAAGSGAPRPTPAATPPDPARLAATLAAEAPAAPAVQPPAPAAPAQSETVTAPRRNDLRDRQSVPPSVAKALQSFAERERPRKTATAPPARTQGRSGGPARPAQGQKAAAPQPQPLPQTQKPPEEALARFGSRPAVGGKPRFLGLALTGALLLLLLLVGLWAALFLDGTPQRSDDAAPGESETTRLGGVDTVRAPEPLPRTASDTESEAALEDTTTAQAEPPAAEDALAAEPEAVTPDVADIDRAVAEALAEAEADAGLETAEAADAPAPAETEAVAADPASETAQAEAAATTLTTEPRAEPDAAPSVTEATGEPEAAPGEAERVAEAAQEEPAVPEAPQPSAISDADTPTRAAGAASPGEPVDEIFLALPDPALSPAPVARLASLPEAGGDGLPQVQASAPPFGAVYRFAPDGTILATPEGIVTPDGVMLVAGRPSRLPPPRPGDAEPEAGPAAEAAEDRLADDAATIAASGQDTPASGDAPAPEVAAAASEPEPAQPEPAAPAAGSPSLLGAGPVAPEPAETFEAIPALAGFRPQARPEPRAGLPAATRTPTEPEPTQPAAAPAPAPATEGPPAAAAPVIAPIPAPDVGAQPGDRSQSPIPRARPASIVALAEAEARAQAEAAAAAARAAEEAARANATAVAISRRPAERPANFTRTVEAAVAAAIRAQPQPETAPAQAQAPTPAAVAAAAPRQPSSSGSGGLRNSGRDMVIEDDEPDISPSAVPNIPTRASVARQATVTRAISLNRLNLIGVYGTANNRHALVRQPNGRFVQVRVGDRLDGGQVIAIGQSELQLQKGGRVETLALPRG
ncbi:MAG: hypothetical protein ACK4KW_01595 [Gemmobacter sp.]